MELDVKREEASGSIEIAHIRPSDAGMSILAAELLWLEVYLGYYYRSLADRNLSWRQHTAVWYEEHDIEVKMETFWESMNRLHDNEGDRDNVEHDAGIVTGVSCDMHCIKDA